MRHMKKWYLINTKPRQEITAIINLENQGYTIYCPIVKINKKDVVLFPGYIFIYLDKHNENYTLLGIIQSITSYKIYS